MTGAPAHQTFAFGKSVGQLGPDATSGEADDLLDGVDAIAAYLRCTRDAVYYARRVGALPIRRLGARGVLYAYARELDAARRDPSTLPKQMR